MEQIAIIKGNDLTEFLLKSRHPIISVEEATQNKDLLGVNELTLKVVSSEPLNLTIKDYCVMFGERYTINKLPNPIKRGENRFETNVILESVQYDLLRCVFLNTDISGFANKPDFTLTGDLQFFAEIIINNANRVFTGQWSLGAVSTTAEKTISFNNEKVLSALQRICQEFGFEFKISQTGENKLLTIDAFGSVIGTTFEYGRGKGLYELSRQTINDKSVVNRLYLYGGTTNIPSTYREFSQRLTIDGGYIEDTDSISAFGVIEDILTLEEIFPKREGTISSVTGLESFVDSSMDFDVNENLVEGLNVKVTMTSGGLSGYSFDLQKTNGYNNSTKTFSIIPFQDENGLKFPNTEESTFQFQVGDKYFIEGISLPITYITQAETKLHDEGLIFLNQNKAPRVQYNLLFDEFYFKDLYSETGIVNVFELGDYVQVLDEDLGIDGAIRVVGITRNALYPYRYVLKLADSYEITIIEKIIAQGKTQSQIIRLNKLYDATKARLGWRNTQELLKMTFDTDGYFDMGNIRPLSVETSMIVVGAKSQQFILRIIIEPNFQGQKNVIKVNSGILVHYLIQETILTWQIAEQTTTLPDDNARYIYAKCNKTDFNDGFIIFSTAQIKPDDDATYYHFLVGVLHSVSENVRWISLTYAATAINGRFIKTGRIQDFSGDTYFDLDTGEIKGKISFINSTGGYVDLETLNDDIIDFIDNTVNFIDNIYPTEQTEVKTQIDGKIEAWFQDTDPNTWLESERDAHNGDMWYQLTNKLLYRYKSITNTWERIEDKDALDAYELASQAQDTADGKRRVFVEEPYPPYDVGDLWTDGDDLRRCITQRLTGLYNPADWNLATYYDNTKTVIDGGIVTSGTVQLAGDDMNIKAGITGQGTTDSSVRVWAGNSYENRAIAPCRILQDGSTYFRTKLVLTDDSNVEQAGICGHDSGTDTGIRGWFGETYANRNTAPCRFYADGTIIATKGKFGVFEIFEQSLINDFDSLAQIVARNDTESQLTAIGTDVSSPSDIEKISGRFEQGSTNTDGWNIGTQHKASGSTVRNVAIYAPDGESILNEATINGTSSRIETLASSSNVSVDVSKFDVIECVPTGTPCGINFTGTVYNGKEVTIINTNDSTPMYLYSTARVGTFEIAGGEVCTMKRMNGYWYIKSRYDNNY